MQAWAGLSVLLLFLVFVQAHSHGLIPGFMLCSGVNRCLKGSQQTLHVHDRRKIEFSFFFFLCRDLGCWIIQEQASMFVKVLQGTGLTVKQSFFYGCLCSSWRVAFLSLFYWINRLKVLPFLLLVIFSCQKGTFFPPKHLRWISKVALALYTFIF